MQNCFNNLPRHAQGAKRPDHAKENCWPGNLILVTFPNRLYSNIFQKNSIVKKILSRRKPVDNDQFKRESVNCLASSFYTLLNIIHTDYHGS